VKDEIFVPLYYVKYLVLIFISAHSQVNIVRVTTHAEAWVAEA
jgi:hypothetical protein